MEETGVCCGETGEAAVGEFPCLPSSSTPLRPSERRRRPVALRRMSEGGFKKLLGVHVGEEQHVFPVEHAAFLDLRLSGESW